MNKDYLERKVESGPAEVIDSGSVISFGGNPITVRYRDLNIAIVFEFATDPENAGTYVNSSIPEPGVLKLSLFNFNDRLGAGTAQPMAIGKYEGHRLYIQLRVYTLAGSPDRTLDYTIYRGEEVSEGEHA